VSAGKNPPAALIPLSQLKDQLSASARMPGYKVLFCAPDVADTLVNDLPPRRKPEPWDLPGLAHDATAGLLAVNIVPAPDSPPGTFRLVSHYDPERRQTTCVVDGTTVTHALCPIVLEGILIA
jgi:hypothetical protein